MRRFRTVFFATCLFYAPVELFAETGRTLGFSLGQTLEEAKAHAQFNGWEVLPSPTDPTQRHWVIEQANARMEVCQNKVFSVIRNYEGSIDAFAALESRVRREILNGFPETKIYQLGSFGQISSFIDAEFAAQDNSRTIVRLRTRGGEATVLSLTWNPAVCDGRND